ncbi:VEM-1 protein [Aphelenchoides avenae]|nr:VEM-1 protein [Aphelenchus avenae]
MSSLFEVGATDIVIIVLAAYVIYRLFFKRADPVPPPPKRIPPLKKQDMTLEELRKYDGVQDEHILLALLGNIYDVSRGRDFYGPEGPYGPLAGHDATRAFATFDHKNVKEDYDDISDLTASDLEDAKEWVEKLAYKYPVVGKLIRPGEERTDYGDAMAVIG